MKKILPLLTLLLIGCGSTQSITLQDGTLTANNAVIAEKVPAMQKMRMGPDGRTVHMHDGEKSYCIVPSEHAPKSFTKFGQYQSLRSCLGRFESGAGYLDSNNNYFAYIQEKDNVFTLVIEKSDQNNNIHRYEASVTHIFAGTIINSDLAKTQYPQGAPGEVPEWSTLGNAGPLRFEAENKTRYIYPEMDAVANDGIVLLSFENYLVAMDTSGDEGILIGENNLKEVMSMTWLASSSSPFVVVEDAWEGSSLFHSIITLKKDALKITSIVEVLGSQEMDFETPWVEFEGADLLLHVYKKTSLLDQLSEETRMKLENTLDHQGAEEEAEAELKDLADYQEIQCRAAGISSADCIGLQFEKTYKLAPSDDPEAVLGL